ncbi:MAG: DUF302 domain-containing protein [Xanthomonadales bacterium]|jgi:uncharacterized protein (DUF302 family)|nr:DUF302 domain-containing protein [Xanthomonadales bacterium]
MSFKGFIVGFMAGIIVLGAVAWKMMPGLMLNESASPYGLEETVDRIQKNAVEAGWVVSGIVKLDASIARHGGPEVPRTWLINLCQANHASRILADDADRVVSVMMPCTISVYEKSDGKTYIGSMNAGLLGRMFGGTVAEVMGKEVSAEQQDFISFAK